MSLKVRIINPDQIVFEGEAEYILAPGKQSALGIFPGHTPMFAELAQGELHLVGNNEQKLAIERGILKVRNDEVTILIGL